MSSTHSMEKPCGVAVGKEGCSTTVVSASFLLPVPTASPASSAMDTSSALASAWSVSSRGLPSRSSLAMPSSEMPACFASRYFVQPFASRAAWRRLAKSFMAFPHFPATVDYTTMVLYPTMVGQSRPFLGNDGSRPRRRPAPTQAEGRSGRRGQLKTTESILLVVILFLHCFSQSIDGFSEDAR